MVYQMSTKLIHGTNSYDSRTGAVSFPIYQSATFRHSALGESTGYDYSRVQNPTREVLEETMATLENGRHGFAFSSGMAAVTALISTFSPGDHIIVSNDLYGGTYRLFEEVYRRFGLDFCYVDTGEFDAVKNALAENTKAVFVESPTNPMMKVADLRAIAALAKVKGLVFVVDNTFLTPFFQKPLDLGAHVVIHSGTKYLGGHNDTLGGFIVLNDDSLAEQIKLVQKSGGAVLAPFDSWLILRGIKTLGVRLERQQENALKIARWLSCHSEIVDVRYVGLEEHEGYEISKAQSTGFGAMISFNVKDKKIVERILKNVGLVLFAESLGGVESLITYPFEQTHNAIPVAMREAIGVNETLLRLSVGIEAVEDIIADLSQAIEG